MAFRKSLKSREIKSEKLDNLNLTGKDLKTALQSLAWINQYFGNSRIIQSSVLNIIQKHPQKKHFKIIDLGCGGGDVILKLAKKLSKEAFQFSIIGIDGNENSLNFAKAKTPDYQQIAFQKADILQSSFQLPNCDILISSHFIYHFEDEDLVHFIKKNLSKVELAFVNSGLERNGLAFWLFRIFGKILPISKLAREDGLLAIRRAFTKAELEAILETVGGLNFELKRVPFFRLSCQIWLK